MALKCWDTEAYETWMTGVGGSVRQLAIGRDHLKEMNAYEAHSIQRKFELQASGDKMDALTICVARARRADSD